MGPMRVERRVSSDNNDSPASGSSPRWACPAERRETMSSDVSENVQMELEDFVNVLTETLQKQTLENEFPELTKPPPENQVFDDDVNVSANTIQPDMMQTITLSAKPKDRVRVIERELESVFEPDIISHCMTILLNANPTNEEESTEDDLTDVLGKEKFEQYIGRFWHLMILSKSAESKYAPFQT